MIAFSETSVLRAKYLSRRALGAPRSGRPIPPATPFEALPIWKVHGYSETMADSEHGPASADNDGVESSTASGLLDAADRVSVRVNQGIDFGTHARILGWSAATLFVYASTFLLLLSASVRVIEEDDVPNPMLYGSVLVIVFVALEQLLQGARNRLPISLVRPLPGRTLWLALPGFLLFLAVGIAILVGVEITWWADIVVALCLAALPGFLCIASVRKARTNPAHRSRASARAPLGRSARLITAGLGIYFGIAGVLTLVPPLGYSIATMVLILIMVAMMLGWSAPWGLPSVGSEWGQRQWTAFGVSFALLFALTLLAAITPWNTAWVGGTVGVLIALPLVLSALPSPHHR